jgi:O-methyltransferase
MRRISKWVGALRGTARSGPQQKSLRGWTAERGLTEYPRLNYDDEDAARAAVAIVDECTMGSYERLVTLWQQVRYLDRSAVPGCLVECGTWRGGASGMMALAHMASGTPQRALHLFDSFEGLPEPDAQKDGDVAIAYADQHARGTLLPIGQCVGALETNQGLIHETIGYPRALTHFHVGWFQDTVPRATDVGSIALLRLDGDWYDSTKICLQYLYPRVYSGGVVVIDDYGKWPGCRRAVDEFMAGLAFAPLLNHIDASARYIIVP